MEALGLTSEQQAIVEERARDVLVSAGAGSGKTRVLVERYVALLDGCRIPEIAAVTFTEAAATEMRERVRRTVLTRDDLAAHRPDVDEAVIGTIHALCRQVLRDHPVEAGIDPLARVLAEDEAEFELLAASMDALEAAAEAADGRALALRAVGVYHLSEHLPRLVARRDEVRSAFRAFPGETPAEWATHVRGLLDTTFAAAAGRVRPEVAAHLEWLRGARTGGSAGSDALTAKLATLMERLGDVGAGDDAAFADRLVMAAADVNLQGGSARNWAYALAEVRERMGAVRELARGLAALPRWNDHDATALEALAALRALFEDACTRYAARKRQLVALDYLDLELEATRLLRDHPEVARTYRDRFRHVMVDEFQDTNPAQVELVRLLVGTAADGARRPHLFLVGDAKQAIYRFRGGDVRHFRRLHRETEAAGGAIHALSRSFRTHDPLVAILNELFASVLGEGLEEHEAPMQAMTGRGGDAPDAPHLVLMSIGALTPDGQKAQDRDRRQVEADVVAAEVARLLEAGHAIWDREAAGYREARPRDVAVLLRRLTNVHLFERALEAHGVPYRTPAGAGFFTRQEVLDLTNLLTWLAEPDDAIALVGTLRSPLFLLDDATLLALDGTRRGWLAALREPPPTIDGATQERCRHAAAVLDELRALAATAPASELIERALALTAFEAVWAPLQGGDQALANIRKFVAIARSLAGRSLDEVATYIRRRRDELDAREGQAVLDDSDAVRILTVHSAKGLEFPVVFVPEAHLPLRDTHDPVRWRTEDGISLTLAPDADSDDPSRRRPGFYAHLLARDHVEERAEHRRLFYVAATRAADALYVSGDESGSDDGWLGLALGALGVSAVDGVDVRPPVPADVDAVLRRATPRRVAVPPESAERGYLSPLAARPPVIPLRSSTPVTALRAPVEPRPTFAHGDGLALVRGSLAHRAIELAFTTSARPDLEGLASALGPDLDQTARARLVEEVGEMLARFETSPLAATLRDPATRAHFELPFSWHWDGVPVHGTIDLVYERDAAWHVVDFKTDDLDGRALAEVAAPYLPQLALYAGALAEATGRPPSAGLLFLRTDERYEAPRDALDAALASTRARIDGGAILEGDAGDQRVVLAGE